jgi:protein-S-isoprenylcysteine O-methyltransferase Ste14
MARTSSRRSPPLEPSPEPPPLEEWEVRMRMVERMLAAFRFERFAYLALSFIACLVLLGASIWLFKSKDTTAALAIFGSSGVLTLTLARMLYMWNQAWKLVAGGHK